MDNCIFCKIVQGDIPSVLIYEDKVAKIILDRFPSTKGHILIISKNHYENIYDVDEKVFLHMMSLALKYAKTVKRVFSCEGVNILQNNEVAAGQSVFHIHIHVIPRSEEDRIGIGWEPTEPSIEELEELASEIVIASREG